MARRAFGVVVVLVSALHASACGTHSCTDIGCGVGISATLTPQSGTWEHGSYALELTMDERKARCTFEVPSSVSGASCGSTIRLELGKDADDFALRVLVGSTPQALELSLSREEAFLITARPMLKYRETEPNGPDCGVCRSAVVDLVVVEP